MVGVSGDPLTVAMDRTLEEHEPLTRMLVLINSVIAESIEGIPIRPETPIPLFMALPEVGPFFSEQNAQNLCRSVMAEFAGKTTLQPVPVTDGNAAGAVAFERAVAGLRSGAFQACIVAGVETFLDPDRLDALGADERIIAEKIRWGFTPGEGAAALLLCTATLARNIRLPVLASIGGIGTAFEPNGMHTDGVCTGEALALAMRTAAVQAGAPVDRQFCDINGERYREHEFSYAILRVPNAAFVDSLDYVAPAVSWGHVGAASIPLLSVVPIANHARGFSPGPWPMIWSSSENGRRGAVVLNLT